MLNIKQITEQYPENLRVFERSLLREYLQYKILEILFASRFANRFSFLGGTALRLIYGNTRFSEDLDFDNFGLTEAEFGELSKFILSGLEAEGLRAEIRTITKKSYRCKIRLPEILFINKMSAHGEETIMIQVDSLAHGFAYRPEKKILNKFDIFSDIFVTPVDLLLSQKICASLNRKRVQGRDFYDVVFLLSLTQPNYEYLKQKIGVDSPIALRSMLGKACTELDFHALALDVQQFLFKPEDKRKVEQFPEYIAQAKL